MTTAEVVSRCPGCGNAELARVADDPPWCPSCEWNLAAWPESTARRRRRRQAAMRRRHESFALDRSLLEEFRGSRPERPRPTRTGLVLASVALGLLLFDLAAIAAGAYVLMEGNWAQRILAALLFLVGIECRLRFFKVDPSFGRLTRVEAPQLFRVLDGAADALGAPRVEVLQIDDDYKAWCARSGPGAASSSASVCRCGERWVRPPGRPCSGTSSGTSSTGTRRRGW